MPFAGTRTTLMERLARRSERAREVLWALRRLAPRYLRRCGKFTIPGLATLKLERKPTTKADKRVRFAVKAKPDTVVKCFAVPALKRSIFARRPPRNQQLLDARRRRRLRRQLGRRDF